MCMIATEARRKKIVLADVGIRSAAQERGCGWASEAPPKSADAGGHPKRRHRARMRVGIRSAKRRMPSMPEPRLHGVRTASW